MLLKSLFNSVNIKNAMESGNKTMLMKALHLLNTKNSPMMISKTYKNGKYSTIASMKERVFSGISPYVEGKK